MSLRVEFRVGISLKSVVIAIAIREVSSQLAINVAAALVVCQTSTRSHIGVCSRELVVLNFGLPDSLRCRSRRF